MPGLSGSVMPRKSFGIWASRPAALTAESVAMACASVSAVPPDFDVTMKRLSARSSVFNTPVERFAVEIVIETRARPRLLAFGRDAGNFPAGDLRQRLAAEARSAGAEEHERLGAFAETRERRFGICDVGCLFGDAQKRQTIAAIIVLQRFDVRADAVEPRRVGRRRQAVFADRRFETSVDILMKLASVVMPVLHGARNAPG